MNDATCRFGLQYRPTKDGVDPVLKLHLRNCPDCQGEFFLVE
jgi:hypothetical protein